MSHLFGFPNAPLKQTKSSVLCGALSLDGRETQGKGGYVCKGSRFTLLHSRNTTLQSNQTPVTHRNREHPLLAHWWNISHHHVCITDSMLFHFSSGILSTASKCVLWSLSSQSEVSSLAPGYPVLFKGKGKGIKRTWKLWTLEGSCYY